MAHPRNKGALTAFWMPEEYRARLVALARKKNMNVSALLRTLIVNAVERESIVREDRP
jgi:hypothetical protein